MSKKTTDKMTRIWTVILTNEKLHETSTVSFMHFADAVAYCLEELEEMDIVNDSNRENVEKELDGECFFSDHNGLYVYIEDACLCDSFTGL